MAVTASASHRAAPGGAGGPEVSSGIGTGSARRAGGDAHRRGGGAGREAVPGSGVRRVSRKSEPHAVAGAARRRRNTEARCFASRSTNKGDVLETPAWCDYNRVTRKAGERHDLDSDHPAARRPGGSREAYQAVYALYPSEYGIEVEAVRRPDGGADSIVAAHSLIPTALRHSMSAYGVALFPPVCLCRAPSTR